MIADWVLDAFLPCDITQLRIFHEEAVHREHFEAGETVFASGDFGDKVYFIVQGEAEVERNGERVAKLYPGDIFGEAALISNQPRNATIRVSTQLDTVAVSRNAFQQLLMHLPGLSKYDAGTHERSNQGWRRFKRIGSQNKLSRPRLFSHRSPKVIEDGFRKGVSAKCSRLSGSGGLRIKLCG